MVLTVSTSSLIIFFNNTLGTLIMAVIRQKKLLKKVIENNGNISKSMREVGYSPETARNPQQVTNSKGWKELLEEYLPDDYILNAIQEDIDNAEKGSRTPILTLATKLKGKLIDKAEVDSSIKVNVKLPEDIDEVI